MFFNKFPFMKVLKTMPSWDILDATIDIKVNYVMANPLPTTKFLFNASEIYEFQYG